MKKMFFFLSLFLLFSCSDSSSNITSSIDSSFSSSLSSSSSSTNVSKPEQATIYSINDLHGAILLDEDYSEPGLARLDYMIKNDEDFDESSFLVSAGDTIQGSYICHEDKLLALELLDIMGVKAMAVGNHEFDWGIDVLRDICENSPIPILGANVLDGQNRQADFLKPSTIVSQNGVKYGIVGLIGPNLENDISSEMLGDYTFSDDLSYVENEIIKLQEEECDVIFLLVHDGSSDDYIAKLASTFNDSISGIFGGHTHQFENETFYNIPYIQGGCDGQGYGKITFDIDNNHNSSAWYERISYDDSVYDLNDSLLDEELLKELNLALENSDGDDTICELIGDFNRYEELPNLVLTAMYEVVSDLYTFDDDLMIIYNTGGIRDNLNSGPVSRSDIYRILPFDNACRKVDDLSGDSLYYFLDEDYYYYFTPQGLDRSKTYDVVTIDYVSTSSYFLNVFDDPGVELNYDGEILYSRDLVTSYLVSQEVIYASDYR